MARTKGTYSLSSNIEPIVAAPLDAREKVALKSDLTAANTFPYPYEGMEVYVVEEKKKYILIGGDPTVVGNWKEVGSEGGGAAIENVQELPITNIENKFYRDVSEHGRDLTFQETDSSLEPFQNQLKNIGFVTDGVLIDNGNYKYYEYTPTYEVRYVFDGGEESPILHARLYTVYNGVEQVVLIMYGRTDDINVSVFAGERKVLPVYWNYNDLYAGNATKQALDRVALLSDITDEDAIQHVSVLPTTDIENKFYRDVSEQTIDLVFHEEDTSLEYFQNQLKKIGFVTDGVLIDKGDWKYYQYTPTYEVRYNFIAGMQRVLHAQLYTVLSGTEQVVLIIYGLDDHVNASVFAGRKTTVLTIYYDGNKLYAGNATEQLLDRVALMSDISDNDAVIYVDTAPNVDDYETGAVICYSGEDSGMFKKGHHYQKVDNVAVEKKCGMATDFKYQTYDTVYFDVDGTVLTDVQNPYNQTEATVEGESSSSWTDCVGFNSLDYAKSNKIRVITRDQEENTLYYCKLILDLNTNVITAGERIDISVNDYAQHVYTVNYIGTGAGWADIGGGGDEEFIGTKAEWNALTAQEKEKYDGKIVNITNDTIAGGGDNTTEFIGTQSEWDALSDAEKDEYEIVNITDDDIGEGIVVGTITRNTSVSESINEAFAQKYGKIAQVHANINGCVLPANTLTTIATTSFRPTCESWMLVSTDYVTDGLRCFMTYSGNIQVLCPNAGTYNIRFDATYITKD